MSDGPDHMALAQQIHLAMTQITRGQPRDLAADAILAAMLGTLCSNATNDESLDVLAYIIRRCLKLGFELAGNTEFGKRFERAALNQ